MYRVVYIDPETECTISINEYSEARNCNRYDGDDSFYGVPVRYTAIRNKKGEYLKGWHRDRRIGRGAEAQRKEDIQKAKDWFHTYALRARWPDKPIRCNMVVHWQNCPLLVAGKDGRAKCQIDPFGSGYMQTSMGARDVPEDGVCDVYKFMDTKMGQWEIPGFPLTLGELWECQSGKALKKIKGEPVYNWMF